MGLIHFILNVVGLLLWLQWVAAMPRRFQPQPGSSLLSTLKPVSSSKTRMRRWLLPVGLVALLLFRTVFYWHLGSAVDWSGSLDLGAVTLAFRSDLPGRMLLFSLLSFLQFVTVVYSSALFLVMVNRCSRPGDPTLAALRWHLGPVARWPLWMQALLPLLLWMVAWLAFGPGLAKQGIASQAVSARHLCEQATVLGLASYLWWKYVILFVLTVHLVNSYVYIGTFPVLTFIGITAGQLLRTMAWLPLRAGKVDFTPLVLASLVLFLAQLAERGLTRLFTAFPL